MKGKVNLLLKFEEQKYHELSEGSIFGLEDFIYQLDPDIRNGLITE
jgi:hypothetical protein